MASAFSLAAAVMGVMSLAVPCVKFGVDVVFRLIA